MTNNRPFGDAQRQAQQAQEVFRRYRGPIIGGGLALLLIAAALGSYYQVEPAEVGVVLRFGEHIGNTKPGPHFKIPLVDRVIKVPVRRQFKSEFGFRTASAGVQTRFAHDRNTKSESQMLTGDLNVAVVQWIVQYTIKSPEKYLFNFRSVENTLRLMSEATMRAVVGDHSIDELLTGGREGIELDAQKLLQDLSDEYGTGLNIEQVKLQDVTAPEPVKPAMREVEEAKQERERLVNEAWAEYNRVIPKAKGQAEQTIQAARGYSVERINRAKGDAARFNALHTEYRKAPDVTRARLYLEAVGEVLPKVKRKIVVDPESKNLVPLLNLEGGS